MRSDELINLLAPPLLPQPDPPISRTFHLRNKTHSPVLAKPLVPDPPDVLAFVEQLCGGCSGEKLPDVVQQGREDGRARGGGERRRVRCLEAVLLCMHRVSVGLGRVGKCSHELRDVLACGERAQLRLARDRTRAAARESRRTNVVALPLRLEQCKQRVNLPLG